MQNRVLGFLRMHFKECPQELREIAYFSMVRSILEYASTARDTQLTNGTVRMYCVNQKQMTMNYYVRPCHTETLTVYLSK